jgi:hypothetical protein
VQIPILDNDTDPNLADNLFIEQVTPAASVLGIVNDSSGSNAINYTAPTQAQIDTLPEGSKIEMLTYVATDGKLLSSQASIEILVANVPDASNDSYHYNAGELWNIDVIANDATKPNREIVIFDSPDESNLGVTITLNEDNNFVYLTPEGLGNTEDRFSYRITDKAISDFATAKNIDLTSTDGPCFSVTSRAEVTIMITDTSVISEQPGKPGTGGVSSSGGGGGTLTWWWLMLIAVMASFARQHYRKN